MSDIVLQEIQALQFSDREAANEKLKAFFNANLPFEVARVSVRPSAVSLNSINGLITASEGKRLFFKTHVEPQSIIDEYYNSGILAKAGYPVIQPVFTSTDWGKQFLVYEYFEAPSLFDVIFEIETGDREDGESIVAIQECADDRLFDIYKETLEIISAAEHAKAPVHQLFHHRLVGGRLEKFYRGAEIALPGESFAFESLASKTWVINGIEFEDTLAELVARGIEKLNPHQETIAAIGHGDAHNGNVFINTTRKDLVYFDPAFAGRHSPWLDLAKPLFHNVFAIWMYFPERIASALSIQFSLQENTVVVEHDFVPSPVRLALLHSKLHRVLKPLLREIQVREHESDRWRELLKLALFCCPLLTMNLRDSNRFSPEITLLGLAMSVEMGSSSRGTIQSRLDTELSAIEAELGLGGE